MIITNLKINRIINPIGFELGVPRFSYIIEDSRGSYQQKARIQISLDEEFKQILLDTGMTEEIDSLSWSCPMGLQPCTRYYWRVEAEADNGEKAVSEAAFFETAKKSTEFVGKFISCVNAEINCDFIKEFTIEKKVSRVVAYVCGLGVYEIEVNRQKAGEEYLAPGCNAYDKWIQYQTYDVTGMLVKGSNQITISTGDGWYKGRFGFDGGADCIYGNRQAVFCDLMIWYEDGSVQTIASDTSWKVRESKVRFSNIYDGEIYDDTFQNTEIYEVEPSDIDMSKLEARRSLPVIGKETVKPIAILQTPSGETVLDMGQNMVGWIQFYCRETFGTQVKLQYGELLQQGNFYRENLRKARAEYIYTSDGTSKWVRPHFTFYGFRYVKLIGFTGVISLDDFEGQVLYSDMEQTGFIETSNVLVNKLIQNALWGQKGNYLDVPMDCPQRDERLGWTGDAQVFAGTAAYAMDVFAFFKKYGYDMWQEQQKNDGMVPMVIPAFRIGDECSSAWADAATIIPWTMYQYYGDTSILEQQYESMKAWVEYVHRQDLQDGGKHLWATGFHFGDWLAMDAETVGAPTGGTETAYISSCYYYYSTNIVSKAAKVIGRTEDTAYYSMLAENIKKAIQREYFTPGGRLALQTQTSYVLALYLKLYPEGMEKRVAADLNQRLIKDKGYLKTGFVGTPYLCRVLSDYGYNEMAYKLLLNRNCPSWLYTVNMGATTIWERWNSVLEDGTMNPDGMNSLNHYAYGSIVEWMYRNMLGIQPMEEAPGFKKTVIAPQPDYRLEYAKGSFISPMGKYESAWEIQKGILKFEFTIPFGAQATLVLPDAKLEDVIINGERLDHQPMLSAEENDSKVTLNVKAGNYQITYQPTVSYDRYYHMEMPLSELFSEPEVRRVIEESCPGLKSMNQGAIINFGHQSIGQLRQLPFIHVSEEEINNADSRIRTMKMKTDSGKNEL